MAEDKTDNIEWLRSRGIEVETPDDRKKQENLLSSLKSLQVGDAETTSFSYVYIAADDSVPLQLETAVLPKSLNTGDQLPLLLKEKFSQGSVDETALRKTAEKHFVGNMTAAPELAKKLTPQAIAGQGGSVEVFKLGEEVNLYLDAVGALKQLPRNNRATAFASKCGFGEVPFFGDMYIGRVVNNKNSDFSLSDADSSAPWLKDSLVYNLNRQAKENNQPFGSTGMDSEEISTIGGTEDNYSWAQTPEDIEISVPLPTKATKGRDCSVKISRRAVCISIKGGSDLELKPLFADIRPDESTWSVGDGHLVITLEKSREGLVWSAVS